MKIRAFQGLRPATASVANLVSLPYDVVNTAEARVLAEGKPQSMLHVVRPEIDFPEGTDPYSDAVYAKAVENFRALQADGHLLREEAPCMYLYQQQWGSHVQQGIVALSHVEDYSMGRIKKHEKTRIDKENDRTRLTDDLSANPGPVFLTYKAQPELNVLLRSIAATQPLYEHTFEDGIRHTVWRIQDCSAIVSAFAKLPATYIADGHHRAASAARVGLERRAINPKHSGNEDYNWFLTVLFPHDQLKILPYNRLVHDLNGQNPAQFLEALKAVTSVTPASNDTPTSPGDARMYLDGQWYQLALSAPDDADPASSLDVAILQDAILAPLLGIDDPRTSKRIDFVGGIRGTAFLKAQVDADKAAVAFSMFPVQIEQLMAIADADQIMPPKSTWFEPKLRSGFCIHTF